MEVEQFEELVPFILLSQLVISRTYLQTNAKSRALLWISRSKWNYRKCTIKDPTIAKLLLWKMMHLIETIHHVTGGWTTLNETEYIHFIPYIWNANIIHKGLWHSRIKNTNTTNIHLILSYYTDKNTVQQTKHHAR